MGGAEIDTRPLVGDRDNTVGIERIGLDAHDDFYRVALVPFGDEAQQSGNHADADDENAGGPGVERAGMADAALLETAAELTDDVVTGDARRLVHDGHAVDRRRVAASPLSLSAGGPPPP